MHDALIQHISGVAWDDSCDAETKLTRIQGLLYQAEQMQDKRTERQFGSDQLSLEEQAQREGYGQC
jgi:hypothetical protein